MRSLWGHIYSITFWLWLSCHWMEFNSHYLPHCIEVSPSILLICQNKESLIYSKLFIPIPIQKHIILYIYVGDGCCYFPLFLGDIFSYNFLLPHISITHVLVVQGKSLPINRHVKSSGTCPGFTLSTGCITGSFLCAFPLFEKNPLI